MHSRYARALALAIVALSLTLGGAAQEPNEGGPQQFSEADAEKLLSTVNDGLVGHSPERFLSAFDAGKMADYAAFAEQAQNFFSLYENFRVHYRILSVSESKCAQGVKGNAMVEFELQGDDANNQVPGISRNGEMQVTFQPGKKGWMITDINREFFR
jgi:hypothetical protein